MGRKESNQSNKQTNITVTFKIAYCTVGGGGLKNFRVIGYFHSLLYLIIVLNDL